MSEIENAMKLLAYRISKDFQKAINDTRFHHDNQASSLAGSVKPVVFSTANSVGFKITANNYWDYYDKGVNGTKTGHASPYSFKGKGINTDWVKSVLAKSEPRGYREAIANKRKKTSSKSVFDRLIKQARFTIGRSMAMKGIKPHHFKDRVMTENNKKEWSAIISQAMKKDMVLNFK